DDIDLAVKIDERVGGLSRGLKRQIFFQTSREILDKPRQKLELIREMRIGGWIDLRPLQTQIRNGSHHFLQLARRDLACAVNDELDHVRVHAWLHCGEGAG